MKDVLRKQCFNCLENDDDDHDGDDDDGDDGLVGDENPDPKGEINGSCIGKAFPT